jgi:RNA polymerase sigma-70 factor (ECF subfamily)
MGKLRRNRAPTLTLVPPASLSSEGASCDQELGLDPRSIDRDVDWSILMARAQNGDRDAYRRLLNEITPYLRALSVRRLYDPGDAEDVVQDVLLTVHKVRQTYDPTRPFGPWLVAIANRRIVDRLRRLGRTRLREDALGTEHETFPAPQANLHEEKSDQRALRQAVEGLSPGQRAAIRLLKLEEKSLKEAAAESGMSVAALKVATHRALGNLRKMLSRRDDT